MSQVDQRILHDDDETMGYGHDVHIPLIEDEFFGDSSGDDESVVSDSESIVTGNRVESVKMVKKSVNGLVKLGEDDKLHGIIVSKFVAMLGEIGVKADMECVYRNMFGASLVSQAKEIDRIVGFEFGYGDVGNCEGFGNAVMLNAYHSPFESVESAIVDDDGVKHILLCRVLLGKTEVVNRFSTQCHPSSEEFNSGVDNAVTPKKYIIWSSQMNTHILPEFIISFKTQRIANRPQVNGVRLEKPVSPLIPIPDLIAKLSKMLPPKSIKEITQYHHSYLQLKITRLDMIRGIKGIAGDRILLMRILHDDDETMSYDHDVHIPLIEDEFFGDSSGDDESVVSDSESVVTGNRVESVKMVKSRNMFGASLVSQACGSIHSIGLKTK
nr:probable inactive poly [ADP-ribose] polymerase SRO5 [Tanacetum cinerariifolium]